MRKLWFASALAAASLLPIDAYGVGKLWLPLAGNWDNPTAWDPEGVPTNVDEALIRNGGTATVLSDAEARDVLLGLGNLSGSIVVQTETPELFITRNVRIDGPAINPSTSTLDPGANWNAQEVVIGADGLGLLNVFEDSVFTTKSAVLAQNLSSSGTAGVSDGATWTVSQDFTVGERGVGTLDLLRSAVLETANGLIAQHSTSTGQVLIDDSEWSVEGDLVIGNEGIAEVSILNGGDLSNGESFVGVEPNPQPAKVIVDGEGSTWSNNGLDLRFGIRGDAELEIIDGGSVSSGSATIAEEASSTSSVLVSGSGSTWTNISEIQVGGAGVATLDVLDGGQVISNDVTVGQDAGSVGTVNVEDAGSKVTARFVEVGIAGEGMLNVTLGADVEAGFFIVGGDPAPPGIVSEVNVSGAGSTITFTEAASIGGHSDGVLNVTANGQVIGEDETDFMAIGGQAGVKGVVNVQSQGSVINMPGDLFIGNFGEGELHITGGADVTSGSGDVGSSLGSQGGTVNVQGTGSTWTSSGAVTVGNGTMTVSGGKVFAGGTDQFRSKVGGPFDGHGEVNVDGAGSEWVNTGIGLEVGGGFGGAGELNITGGGNVSNVKGVIAPNDGEGTVTVRHAGSTWTNSGQLIVGEVGTGVMNVLDGGVVTSASGQVGSLFNDSSGAAVVSGVNSQWQIAGALEIGFDFGGPGTLTILGASSVTAAGGTAIGMLGALAGTGTIVSTVTNRGVVAPGESPGTLNVTGGYIQNSAGALRIEIASAASFDQLLVSGQSNLGGALNIALLGAYTPTPTDVFTILTAGSRLGTFSQLTVTRDSVPAGMFTVSYTSTSVVLSNFQPPAFLAADFDEDHDVDGDDLARWRTSFGLAGSATHMQGNADADSDVDGRDFLVWQRQHGSGPAVVPANVPVPEPATSMLAIMAAVGIHRASGRMPQAHVNL
jgi:T5SS/PEP-CTERM-associated repeat protein